MGNSTELKNTIMLNGAAAPHYNYCGDSILGNDTNLGAGTKLSNYKIGADKQVRVVQRGGSINHWTQEAGGDSGDGSATGCNAVLNPGTVLGRSVLVYAKRGRERLRAAQYDREVAPGLAARSKRARAVPVRQGIAPVSEYGAGSAPIRCGNAPHAPRCADSWPEPG